MKIPTLFFILSLLPISVYSTPLPANDVFHANAVRIDPNALAIQWNIKPGYFLYSDRIQVHTQPNSRFQLGTLSFPEALKKTNAQGVTYPIYRKQLKLVIPVLGQAPGEDVLTVQYQGCSDQGFCYPPQRMQAIVTFNTEHALVSVTENTSEKLPDTSSPKNANPLFSGSTPFILLSFFGFGLLLSFTPCVLPMIPVLSGIIVGRGAHLSTRHAFLLSLSYVMSMSVTYAVVGAIIAAMGHNLQLIMQSSWAIGLFSALFVLLALSMFDFYEVRLPTAWQTALARVTRSQHSGHYLSAAIMGMLSTLILSPCVTAPLIGALGYIAQSGNVALGSLALFCLSFGMGMPLLLVGASAGKWLPKAGHWMNTVKAFFGVLLLATAIYLMGRILPAPYTLALWAALSVVLGVYVGAFIPARSKHEKFRQGFGILLVSYGLIMLVGASRGNDNPLKPIAPLPIQTISTATTPTLHTLSAAKQALANAYGKPIMIDFYADWCVSCKVMETTTLRDPNVQAALTPFVILKVDLTQNNAESRALLQYFQVVAPPTFLFFNKQGVEETNLRLVGETSPAVFLKSIRKTNAI